MRSRFRFSVRSPIDKIKDDLVIRLSGLNINFACAIGPGTIIVLGLNSEAEQKIKAEVLDREGKFQGQEVKLILKRE